jgi:hypothetical protein
VTLDVNVSVTYLFKNLDYDDCLDSYIVAESDTGLYEFENFIVEEQSTV